MDYNILNALPAKAFLLPNNFVLSSDARQQEYCREQYKTGLQAGKDAKMIFITYGSTWAATMKSGSYLTSYEGIGYHAGTADLLRGFLDSGCPIVVHRLWGPDAKQSVLIK